MRTHPLSVLLALLLALAFMGRPAPTPATPEPAPEQRGTPPTAVRHEETTLTLPDGQVMTTSDREPFRGANVTLLLEMVGVQADVEEWWNSAVGDHSEIVTREQIALPSDQATLALVKRTPPAASGSTQAAFEYWLMVPRPDPARKDMKAVYSLVAQVTGETRAARQEVLELARGWRLPDEPDAR